MKSLNEFIGEQLLKGYDDKELVDSILVDIKTILNDNGFDDCEPIELWPNGSRVRGTEREDSDIDMVLFYRGKAREDDVFNILHDESIEIDGISVDINPIRVTTKSEIDRHKRKSLEYDKSIRECDLATPDNTMGMGNPMPADIGKEGSEPLANKDEGIKKSRKIRHKKRAL